jgi:hypothetical protein
MCRGPLVPRTSSRALNLVRALPSVGQSRLGVFVIEAPEPLLRLSPDVPAFDFRAFIRSTNEGRRLGIPRGVGRLTASWATARQGFPQAAPAAFSP